MKYLPIILMIGLFIGCEASMDPCEINDSNEWKCAMMRPSNPGFKETAEARAKAHLELIRQLETRVSFLEYEIIQLKAGINTVPYYPKQRNEQGWAILPR